MTNAYVVEEDVLEGTDNTNVAAVAVAVPGQADESLVTQADINGTIAFAIYLQGNASALFSASLNKTDVWFNTPQTDAFWKNMDSVGYNFRHQVSIATVGSSVLRGGRRFHMVYSVPTLLYGTLKLVHIWNVLPLHAP